MKYFILILTLLFFQLDQIPIVRVGGLVQGKITIDNLRNEKTLKVDGFDNIKIIHYRLIHQSYDTLIKGNRLPVDFIEKHMKRGQYFFITDIIGTNETDNNIQLNSLFFLFCNKTSKKRHYNYETSICLKDYKSVSKGDLLNYGKIPIMNNNKVYSFEMDCVYDGYIASRTNSNEFTQRQEKIINNAEKGNYIFFRNIYTVSTNNDTIRLTPFYIQLK